MSKFIVNAVSAFRVIAAVLVIALYANQQWAAIIVVLVAAFASDWLDGLLARRWRVVSQFGTFFDPLADKFIALTTTWIAAVHYRTWLYALAAVVLTAYDVSTNVIRFVSSRSNRGMIKTSLIAKAKTMVLMLSLLVIFTGILGQESELWFGPGLRVVGLIGLVAAAVMSLVSLWSYLAAARLLPWTKKDAKVG